MKIKTSELIGPALDWAVAKCEGFKYELYEHNRKKWENGPYRPQHWQPSTDWAQGGPIIEQELVTVMHRSRPGPYPEGQVWNAVILSNNKCGWYGSTPLIAAMRCYVASKLGDEVDVPEELL